MVNREAGMRKLSGLKRLIGVGAGLSVLVGSLGHGPVSARAAGPFTVDSAADSVDAAPGNGACLDAGGLCSLRAAVMEANALAGPDVVILPSGTYSLTIA